MRRVKLVPGHKSSCPIVVIEAEGDRFTLTGKLIGALEPQAFIADTVYTSSPRSRCRGNIIGCA